MKVSLKTFIVLSIISMNSNLFATTPLIKTTEIGQHQDKFHSPSHCKAMEKDLESIKKAILELKEELVKNPKDKSLKQKIEKKQAQETPLESNYKQCELEGLEKK